MARKIIISLLPYYLPSALEEPSRKKCTCNSSIHSIIHHHIWHELFKNPYNSVNLSVRMCVSSPVFPEPLDLGWWNFVCVIYNWYGRISSFFCCKKQIFYVSAREASHRRRSRLVAEGACYENAWRENVSNLKSSRKDLQKAFVIKKSENWWVGLSVRLCVQEKLECRLAKTSKVRLPQSFHVLKNRKEKQNTIFTAKLCLICILRR